MGDANNKLGPPGQKPYDVWDLCPEPKNMIFVLGAGCLKRNVFTERAKQTIYLSNSTFLKDFVKIRIILLIRPGRLADCLLNII